MWGKAPFWGYVEHQRRLRTLRCTTAPSRARARWQCKAWGWCFGTTLCKQSIDLYYKSCSCFLDGLTCTFSSLPDFLWVGLVVSEQQPADALLLECLWTFRFHQWRMNQTRCHLFYLGSLFIGSPKHLKRKTEITITCFTATVSEHKSMKAK